MKRIICGILLACSLVIGLGATGGVVSATNDCKSAQYGNVTINCPPDQKVETGKSGQTVEQAVSSAIGYVMYVVGALSVIVIIMGGIMYATATGDESKTAKAKKIIIGAIVGLAFAILASILVEFVKRQIG